MPHSKYLGALAWKNLSTSMLSLVAYLYGRVFQGWPMTGRVDTTASLADVTP